MNTYEWWLQHILRRYLADFIAWCDKQGLGAHNPRAIDQYLKACYRAKERVK